MGSPPGFLAPVPKDCPPCAYSCFDDPRNVRRVIRGLVVACVLLVVLAQEMRRLRQRDEDHAGRPPEQPTRQHEND